MESIDTASDTASPSPVCPGCGVECKTDSRFCASCGHNLTDTPSLAHAPTDTPAPEQPSGQYSPDGKWWWNGTQWVPVPVTAAMPPVTTMAPTVPVPAPKQRKKIRMALRATTMTATFTLITTFAFLCLAQLTLRSGLVTIFGAGVVIGVTWLLVLATVRFIRGQRSKTLPIVALVVLVVEIGLAGGLNAYADSLTVATTSVIQDYYAQVADAVSLGNAVAAGKAPGGVTFATVQAEANQAEFGLKALDAPAELVDYRGSVQEWAYLIGVDAEYGASGWQDVPIAPDPFALTMTTDQADAAVVTSLQLIQTLKIFGDRANAVQNLEGIRYIGARLDAQSYWLEAIYTSADPGFLSAHLHFVEPIANYPITAVIGDDMMLVASSSPSWPIARHWSNCNPRGFAPCNIPQLQGPLRTIIRGSLAMQNKYSNPTPEMTTAETQLEAIPGIIDGSGGQPLTGAGSGQEAINTPPPDFAAKCKAEGGTFGGSIYDRTQSRVPTSEMGWTCQTPGNKCFDLKTYSGAEYRGGQPGCAEQGLIPSRPLDIFRNGGGGTSPQGGSPSSTPPGPTSAPPANLPPGFPTNLPPGQYDMQLSGTGVGNIDLGTFPLSNGDLSSFAQAVSGAAGQYNTDCAGTCSMTYSGFDGSSFSVSWTDCSTNPCSTGRLIITKVG